MTDPILYVANSYVNLRPTGLNPNVMTETHKILEAINGGLDYDIAVIHTNIDNIDSIVEASRRKNPRTPIVAVTYNDNDKTEFADYILPESDFNGLVALLDNKVEKTPTIVPLRDFGPEYPPAVRDLRRF